MGKKSVKGKMMGKEIEGPTPKDSPKTQKCLEENVEEPTPRNSPKMQKCLEEKLAEENHPKGGKEVGKETPRPPSISKVEPQGPLEHDDPPKGKMMSPHQKTILRPKGT